MITVCSITSNVSATSIPLRTVLTLVAVYGTWTLNQDQDLPNNEPKIRELTEKVASFAAGPTAVGPVPTPLAILDSPHTSQSVQHSSQPPQSYVEEPSRSDRAKERARLLLQTPKEYSSSVGQIHGHEYVRFMIADAMQFGHGEDVDPYYKAPCMARVRESAILLFGPPGTGKTALVKSIAYSKKLSFMMVTSGNLLDKFAGEAEA